MNLIIDYKAIAFIIFALALALVALAACGGGGSGDASDECIEANEQAGLDEHSLQLLKDIPVSDWSDGDMLHVAFAFGSMQSNASFDEMSHIEDVCEELSAKLEEEVDKRDF